jgi:UDP-glucuronate decarboxylase
MRYLVTGAAGFLGANLSLRLLEEGHEVIGLDNMSTGFSHNLEALKKNKKFTFIKHDITMPLPKIDDIDYVYNLACPASPPRYQKDPVQTFRTSVWGIWNLISLARNAKISIFHTSTSEVYGDPLVHPQNEGYWGNVNPIGVRACYDEGKRGAEALLMDYHRQAKNPIKIVRIFNTYGQHMDPKDGRVISNFLTQAIGQKPLTLYGDGKQSRSFCYVDDLIEGIVKMEKSPAGFIGPVNLGNPDEFTLLELADKIDEITKRKNKREFLPLPKDDPKQRRPDISLAKEKLGWQPKTKLKDGLRRTFEYFKRI